MKIRSLVIRLRLGVRCSSTRKSPSRRASASHLLCRLPQEVKDRSSPLLACTFPFSQRFTDQAQDVTHSLPSPRTHHGHFQCVLIPLLERQQARGPVATVDCRDITWKHSALFGNGRLGGTGYV